MAAESQNARCQRACKLSMFSIVFLDMIGVGIVIPTLAVLFLETDMSILPVTFTFSMRTVLYGLLIAVYPLMQFFGAPILGALSDRHGRKKMLLLSISGTLAGYILFAIGIMTRDLSLLFIGRMIDGFTGGNISIASSAIADISDKKSKARNFGMIGMAFGFGFIIGPFLGGHLSNPALVSWFNLSTPFWFAAALTIFNMFLLVSIFPETLKTRVNTRISPFTGFRSINRAFRMPSLRIMFLVIFILGFGFNFYTQFGQVFLIEKFHFTQVDIGNYFAYTGFWIAFAQGAITRPLSRRFSPPKVLRFSIVLLGLTLPMLLIPTQAIYLFLITPFMAIFQGLTYPNSTAIVSNLSDEKSQGEILGINQSIQSLAQAIPPLIAGFIASIDYTLPIVVASICTIAGWLIFIAFFGKKRHEPFHEV